MGHSTPRSVVAYTLQMFAEATPKVCSSFTNVKKWASAVGYAIDKILGLTSEMLTDTKVTAKGFEDWGGIWSVDITAITSSCLNSLFR